MPVSFKPLRKPEFLILSDQELHDKRETKEAASRILSEKKTPDRFESLVKDESLFATFSRDNFFPSSRNFSDYVCGIINTKIVSDEAVEFPTFS